MRQTSTWISRSGRRVAQYLALPLAPALLAGPAIAQPAAVPAATAAASAKDRCLALAGYDGSLNARLAKSPEAPVTITAAVVVPAGGDGSAPRADLPEHCRIVGQIAPNTGFLLRLPMSGWNGKFMMGGCGGPCGNFLEDRIDPALARNYAVVTTDMGHKGTGWTFGYDNPIGMIDFGYRATHLTARAAKQIVAAFYGTAAKFSYFFGCSTGGRQGMVEAQRFPWDFDGIVAGALPWTQVGYQMLNNDWPARHNTRSDGSLILGTDKLPMIHKAVMATCDAADGLKDGLLQNPLGCKFRPAQLLCKPGAPTSDCLTAEQVAVLQKIYDGPYTGEDGPRYHLGQGGLAPGSELKWRNLGPWRGDSNTQSKYFSIYGPRGPGFDDRTVDIQQEVENQALVELLFSPMNHDLRNYKATGGKLILFHGWDDGVPVPPTIDYYEASTRLMGGEAATRDFFRLFLAPGMDHCRGGTGVGEVDWITAIEDWVEKKQAPDQVIGYHYNDYPAVPRAETDYGAPYMRTARHPLPPGSYDRAQPIYAYPDTAIYGGKGDAKDPATWRKAPKPTRLAR